MLNKKQLKIVTKYVKSLASLYKTINKLNLTFSDYYFHVNSIKNKIKFIEDNLGITIIKNKNNLFYYNKIIAKIPILNTRKYIAVDE